MRGIHHIERIAIGITIVAFLMGCSKKVEVPEPNGSAGPVPISVGVSYLTVGVSVKLADVEAIVNRFAPPNVPGTFNITVDVPHLHFHGMFSKPTVTHDPVVVAHIDYNAARGQITLVGASDNITIHSMVAVSGKLILSSAAVALSGTVDGSSTLTVSPDYSLNPSVGLKVNVDKATVLHAISIQGLVQSKVNDGINNYKGTISSEISKAVNLRKYVETAWNDLPGCSLVPEARKPVLG
jgi:hypothetical protein